jgi:hypothetical protein
LTRGLGDAEAARGRAWDVFQAPTVSLIVVMTLDRIVMFVASSELPSRASQAFAKVCDFIV